MLVILNEFCVPSILPYQLSGFVELVGLIGRLFVPSVSERRDSGGTRTMIFDWEDDMFRVWRMRDSDFSIALY